MPRNRIHKRQDGRYSYKATDADGKRHSITSRKDETLTAFRARCNDLDEKCEHSHKHGTFDALFYLWVDQHVRPNLSAGEHKMVIDRYERHVQDRLGDMQAADIKREHVYQLLTELQDEGLSASSIRLVRGCISRPFNWAVNTLGLSYLPPTQGLVFKPRQKRAKKRNRVISDEDMRRFFEAAKGNKYYNYFCLLRLTGLRPSEALGLQIRDITPDGIKIQRAITRFGPSDLKTAQAARTIPITPEINAILERQIAKIGTVYPGWLFPSSSGEPVMDLVQGALSRIKRQTAEHELGGCNGRKKLRQLRPPVKISLYDFRHTFATKLAQAGCNQKALQTIMGHASISITLEYYVGMTQKMMDETESLMSEIGL